MKIKVPGSCCPTCHRVEDMSRAAVKDLGIEATVLMVTDIGEIARYGFLAMPGLIVNGRLKLSGQPLPNLDKMKALLKEEA